MGTERNENTTILGRNVQRHRRRKREKETALTGDEGVNEDMLVLMIGKEMDSEEER